MSIKDKIINALKAGKVVTYCGHNVTLEGNYSWQVKNLWVNLNNGAVYKAGTKEVRAMIVPDYIERGLLDVE